jgi:hypothetical protein
MAAYQKKNSTVAETTTTQVAPISRAVVDWGTVAHPIFVSLLWSPTNFQLNIISVWAFISFFSFSVAAATGTTRGTSSSPSCACKNYANPDSIPDSFSYIEYIRNMFF